MARTWEGWYAGEDEKNNKIFYYSKSSPEAKFIVQGFEVAQES